MLRKIGLIIIVIMTALGGVGIAHAMWADPIEFTWNVSTAKVSAVFQQAAANDTSAQLDPVKQGLWVDGDADPLPPVTLSWTAEEPSRHTNWSAASTSVTGATTDTLYVNISGAYAGETDYWGSAGCTILNDGEIPLAVEDVSVNWIALPEGGAPTDVTVLYSGMLDKTASNQIEPGGEAIGGLYFQWNTVADTSVTGYQMEVSVRLSQYNTAADPAKVHDWSKTLTIVVTATTTDTPS